MIRQVDNTIASDYKRGQHEAQLKARQDRFANPR